MNMAFNFDGGPGAVIRQAAKRDDSPGIILRPYQDHSVSSIFEKLAENRSTLLVLFTGGGKTTIFSEVTKLWKLRRPEAGLSDRVLVLAHRWELIDQARKRISAQTGERVDIEQGDNYADKRTRIVVGSIQTIFREQRRARWAPDHFGLVIIDEAHHAAATSYKNTVEYFGAAKLLGVTATPDRGDRLALGQVFDSVAHVYDIADGIRDKWLVPIVPYTVPMAGLDFSNISTVAGDLNQGELDAEMAKVTEGVARVSYDESQGRQTVIFTTSVDNARDIAGWLNTIESGCAVHVNGAMAPEQRRAAFDAYGSGRARFLANVMVATEGWDDPPTSCVVIGRPTKSRALLTQMIGRGLRLHHGKQDCLVIDLGGNAGRHSLASPLDVLGGKYTDEEVALAKEIARAKRGIKADEALEEAHEQIKERKAAEARKVSYHKQKFDIFGTFGIERDTADDMDYQFGRRDPTPWQMETLKRWESWKWLTVPGNLSRREAEAIISKVKARQANGWASPGQCRILVRNGFSPNIRKDQASRIIEALSANGFKPLPRAVVQSILGEGREPGMEG